MDLLKLLFICLWFLKFETTYLVQLPASNDIPRNLQAGTSCFLLEKKRGRHESTTNNIVQSSSSISDVKFPSEQLNRKLGYNNRIIS